MRHEKRIALRIFLAVSGISVVTIAVLSLADYFLDFGDLSQWGKIGVPMAVNTAICFFVVGTALGVLAISEQIWRE